MIWQDFILSIGGWILNISAMSIVIYKSSSVPRTTSATQFVVLLAFTFTYISLGLLSAAGSVAVGSAIWLFIYLYQNPRKIKPKTDNE